MNLIIAAGNTRVKLFVFGDNSLFLKEVCDQNDFEKKIKKIFKKVEISRIIVSSVGALTEIILEKVKNFRDVVVLSHQTKVPFTNLYHSPNTLGVDRIALVSAASVNYPNQNVLTIDAGTCVTFDFINKNNEYLGGAISLGLQMRFKALHHFTNKLPLLDEIKLDSFIGSDTKTSIESGVINGLLIEIDGVINQYKEKFGELTIVLTGGDGYYLSKRLKNSIFANPNFLQEGLNSILTYNN